MTVRIDWRGAEIDEATRRAAAAALFDAGAHLAEESNRTVPFEEGTLQRSSTLTTDAEGLLVALAYDTPYAVRLHENPQYNFQHGRRGKWLQLTLQEQAARIEGWLRDRLAEVFR